MGDQRRYSITRYSADQTNQGTRPVGLKETFSEELSGIVRTTNHWGRKGRYSLLRYSVNIAKKSIPVSAAFSESLNTVAGSAVAIECAGKFRETAHGSIQGTVAVISSLSAYSGLFTSARMSADVVTASAMFEALQAVAYGQKDIPGGIISADVLDASVWGSKDIPATMALADRLTAQTAGSKNIPAPLQASEIMTSIMEATSQTTERTTIQITIPPGGELRIDSELFIVLLNGENALHTQSGDWINISRNLLRLIVESASGGKLQGQLIYTERYL